MDTEERYGFFDYGPSYGQNPGTSAEQQARSMLNQQSAFIMQQGDQQHGPVLNDRYLQDGHPRGGDGRHAQNVRPPQDVHMQHEARPRVVWPAHLDPAMAPAVFPDLSGIKLF